jgi:BirA family biotin operon repressor/biotin-[acetyl-CoA-carboxylase] ligase
VSDPEGTDADRTGTAGADAVRVRQSRLPIDPAEVTSLLRHPGPWTVRHVTVTGSTNADLADAAGTLQHGAVLITEEQLTGRGRAGRDWFCPRGAGLMFSVLLRQPEIPPERRGWFGAVLGLAIVRAMTAVSGIGASLKWPNDVLIDGRKCAGILGEVADDAIIIGSGINVSLQPSDLPRADATSLLLAAGDGAGPDALNRAALLAGILDEFGVLLRRWVAAGGDIDASGLRGEYLGACTTVGSRVRLILPSGSEPVLRAVDVAVDGSLVVLDEGGVRRSYSVADVVHLRPDR